MFFPSPYSPVMKSRITVCAQQLVEGELYFFLSRKKTNPVAQCKGAPYSINQLHLPLCRPGSKAAILSGQLR